MLLVGIAVQLPTTFLSMLEVVKTRLRLRGSARLAALVVLLAGVAVVVASLDSQVGLVGCLAALGFAALYAVVLLCVAAASRHFQEAGVLVLSGLAAIPGADAPTLSLARLSSDGELPLHAAAQGVMMVAVVTTAAKAGLVVALGRGAFVRRVAARLLVLSAVGLILQRFAL